MKISTFTALVGCAASAVADLTTMQRPTETTSQSDGIISSCGQFYKAKTGDDCRKVVTQSRGTLSFEDFVRWNPNVGSFCSNGLIAGEAYCVGVEGTPTETAAAATDSSTAVDTCGHFYQAATGDTCYSVVGSYSSMSFEEFIEHNPTVGKFCANGLISGAWYYVGNDVAPQSPSTRTR